MPIFLHGLIMISNCPIRHKVDVIHISITVVGEVMARTCCDQSDQVEVLELCHVVKSTFAYGEVGHLGHVCAM